VKAAALIRAKKLSPVDYVDSVLKAIERAQPSLNCFRVVMAEEARRDAKKAEQPWPGATGSDRCTACPSA
jgi:aspartyl-tRNA(Asn)/glutamyl-tRNA(Gln) amidotransferase subunit A